MLDFSNVTSAALTALLVVTGTFLIYCKWAFAYWRKRNLMCVEEPTILVGNALIISRKKFVVASAVKKAYDLTKFSGFKHAGAFVFTVPIYIVADPNIIKIVLQQGFENFSKRLYDTCKSDDVFAANLAFVGGERWRSLRAKLTPALTPGKIRIMLDGMVQCAYQIPKELDNGNTKAIDIKQVALCYFADVIGACVYGLNCNSFKNPNSKFITHAKKLIDLTSKYRLTKLGLKATLPKLAEWLRISIYYTESSDFFINLAKETAKYRKHNNIVRKDLFQCLLEAETELNVEELDDEASDSATIIKDMASQVFLFFVAGFETSSITFSYCLYELSQNTTIQDTLRDELDRVLAKYEGKITYDAIMEMKYLNQVVDETLRKYPPVPFITRRCVKDYNICETIIEKGILVFISCLGLHRDPDYYPDPETFDPERFSEENKNNLIPFTYLPFGEGPRNCPAYHFGLIQIKVGLVALLQHYRVSLNKKTILPIVLDAGSFTLMPKSPILLDIENRNYMSS